jgi:predicted nucleotidyltransferase
MNPWSFSRCTDVLVHNAGHIAFGPAEAFTPEQFTAHRTQRRERPLLVLAHQPRIAGDIDRQNGRQPSLDPPFAHLLASALKRRMLGYAACRCERHRRTGALMIDAIQLRREELRPLCRRFHVRRLDLFGSAARGDFDPERSDFDFLVEFDRAHPDALSLRTYFGLKEALEGLLGRPVDLVEPGAVRNPYLKASIEGSREQIFAA